MPPRATRPVVALVALLAALPAGCGGRDAQPRPAVAAGGDARALAEHLRSTHPDLHHDVGRAAFDRSVAELAAREPELSPDELLVGLMRLAALPGERDGHGGIFPLDPGHERALHLFGLRLHGFAGGVHVVDQAGGRDLAGARVVAVDGTPWQRVAEAVRPLVPHDNEHSLEARLPLYAATAEVLHGLGVTRSPAGPARWTFERGGARLERTLRPIAADRFLAAFPDLAVAPQVPPALPDPPATPGPPPGREALYTRRTAGGCALYVGYDLAMEPTGPAARRVRRSSARAVVVDVRGNPGGDNGTYEPLVRALARPRAGRRVVVLVSRATFSAATQFVAELEARGDPILVGEPTGGSPRMYGDPSGVTLERSGLHAHAATLHWEPARAGDDRLAIEPDVEVRPSAADHFAGRDPVLARGLAAGGCTR